MPQSGTENAKRVKKGKGKEIRRKGGEMGETTENEGLNVEGARPAGHIEASKAREEAHDQGRSVEGIIWTAKIVIVCRASWCLPSYLGIPLTRRKRYRGGECTRRKVWPLWRDHYTTSLDESGPSPPCFIVKLCNPK